MKSFPALLSLSLLFFFTFPANAQDRTGKSLSGDKRVATLGDVQGIVSVRSPIETRWSLARPERALTEGDWLRTDVRGANAVRAVLANGARLVLGPGTLVELQGPGKLKLIRGELEIAPVEGVVVDFNGIEVKKSGVWRMPEEGGEPARLGKEPLWLSGFKGVMTTEAMGSLVAKVDGRDVPLTVGYHKVNIEIRDQIARTTIEESFVNHTKTRTEGVFYFPLPQEASISGFGMWIGNELVEADVVEKQRAREIYETILREKRDPGLLEWTGGNLFKARVFPIMPRSEKRIKITYTQVLPLEGEVFRYRYGLDSELLRQNPVRELEINVRIFSAEGIEQVVCPTHAGARVEKTEHAASVRFEAQEYAPDRDFEILVKPVPPESSVTLIPHRRGEDGYFLASLRIPELQAIRAETLPERDKPLEILFLADTSGSIDDSQREVQADVISAVLNQLGDADRFNLAVCDVNCAFWSDESRPVNGQTVEQARAFLDQRISMGWSDLGKTFAEAMKQIGPKTQVIYLGDGIPATAQTDPVAFADELKRRFKDKGTFHAIATGSTHEAVVMKAIASLGGGSFRIVGGSDTPAAVAGSLMEEITRPGYRDLKVSFEGVRTASVYPAALANVPAGSQRFVAGRYLPGEKAQDGEMVIAGRYGGNAVEWRIPVTFDDSAEDGHENAFIPRLWARKHLDALLEQGATQAIRDEIISLSEEYKIMTPYTSFLVLESESDRKRFKVKRRFQMRGGEEYFTEGAEAARFELTRAQMQRAAAWRRNLRARVLAGLEKMGRGPIASEAPQNRGGLHYTNARAGSGYGGGGFGRQHSGTTPIRIDYGIPVSGELFKSKNGDSPSNYFLTQNATEADFFSADDGLGMEETKKDFNSGWGYPDHPASTHLAPMMPSASASPASASSFPVTPATPTAFSLATKGPGAVGFDGFINYASQPGAISSPVQMNSHGFVDTRELFSRSAGGRRQAFNERIRFSWELGSPSGGKYRFQDPYISLEPWILSRFPAVGAAGPKRAENPKAGADWPDEIRQLAGTLLRKEVLIGQPFEFQRAIMRFNTRREVANNRHVVRILAGNVEGEGDDRPWLVQSGAPDAGGTIEWSTKDERGFHKIAEGLGRTRKAVGDDGDDWLLRLGLPSGMIQPLWQSYHLWESVRLEPAAERDSIWLVFTTNDGKTRQRFRIDQKKKLIVAGESWSGAELTGSSRVIETVEFAGSWWPKVLETLNREGQVTHDNEFTYRELTGDAFETGFAESLAATDDGILLGELPGLVEARRRIEAGEATLEDWMVLIVRYSLSQEPEEAEKNIEKFAAAAGGDAKAGSLRWLWLRHFNLSRQMETLRLRALEEAARIAAHEPAGDAMQLVKSLQEDISSLDAGERIEILKILRPAFERADAADWRLSLLEWRREVAQLTDSFAGAGETERLENWRSLAADYDFDSGAHHAVASHLWNSGEREVARQFVREQLDRDYWNDGERWQFRNFLLSWWEQEGRYEEVAAYLADLTGAEGVNNSQLQKYLQGLLWSGQTEKHGETLRAWARETIAAEGPLEPAAYQKATAVINEIQGNGPARHRNFIYPRWEPLLTELADGLFRDPDKYSLAGMIVNNWKFHQLDAYAEIRKETGEFLTDRGPSLEPNHLEQLYGWADLDPEEWKTLTRKLVARWRNEDEPKAKERLGAFLAQKGVRFSDWEGYLDFLRERIAVSDEAGRHLRAAELFEQLLNNSPGEENENEAYALLPELIPADEAHTSLESALVTAINSLIRLSDRVESIRQEEILGEVENPDELSRSERQALLEQAVKAGREAVVARLRQEIDRETDDPRRAKLRPWFELEAVYFQSRLEADIPALIALCLDWLGDSPANWDDENFDALDRARLSRVLEIALHLAAAHAAELPETQHLLDFVHAGAELEDENAAAAWRRQGWRLLVALDTPEQLEKSLRAWIEDEPLNPSWKQSLGYLLAETDRIAEAAEIFEGLAEEKMLAAAEFAALAGWHQALDNKEAHERAEFRGLRASNEQQLNQAVNAIRSRVQSKDGGSTGELTERDIEVLTALLATAQRPEQYSWQVRNLYEQTKDPRVPAAYIGGLIGRSAGQIYPVLLNFFEISRMIEEEASVDAAIAEIARFRDFELAKNPTDLRALDLVEAELKRRASEVLNQPGQHIGAAVDAMKRAFARDWADGERVLMAQWLSRLSDISQEAVRAEAMREFAALHRDEPEVMSRLKIAHQWGISLNAHRLYPEAVTRVLAAVQEAREANHGRFTPEMQNPYHQALMARSSLQHYRENERSLRAEIGRAANPEVDHWLKQQLFDNYRAALNARGATDLGDFPGLFRAARKELIAEIENTHNANHRYNLINSLTTLHRSAANAKIADAGKLMIAFSSNEFPELAARDWNRTENMTGLIANAIHGISGSRDALVFVVDMLDREPGWRQWTGNDIWRDLGHRINRYRTETGDKIGAKLGDRTLGHMSAWLRRAPENREERYLEFCNVDSSYCWHGKIEVFARIIEEHIERNRESTAAVQFAAMIFHNYLDRYNRASDVMLGLHAEKRLDESGRQIMGGYLESAKRWKDSERIHRELTKDHPGNAQYQARLIRALFQQDRTKAAARALAEAEELFRDKEKGWWHEHSIVQLADIALETRQFERAVVLFSDLIPMAENARQNRGVGEGTVSRYYNRLAEAHQGLGQTKEAVDAVSAAIVSWGPNFKQRKRTIENLKQLLLASPDLDGYAQQLDAAVEETGLENPIVRKALGEVYFDRKEFKKAARHLRLAADSQPNDAETHQKLVAALDQLGDAAAARNQLIASIRLAPRELVLIRDLAGRYRKAENSLGAERALTGLVEAMPNEAEGHAALATAREEAKSWDDAIAHWKRVADLRELEPTGLIGVARTQAKSGQIENAGETLETIRSKVWPNRFHSVIEKTRRFVDSKAKGR